MSSMTSTWRTCGSAIPGLLRVRLAALGEDGDQRLPRLLPPGLGDLLPVREGVEYGLCLIPGQVAGGAGQVAADDVLADAAGLLFLGLGEGEDLGEHGPECGELAAFAAGGGAMLIRVERQWRWRLAGAGRRRGRRVFSFCDLI